MRHTLAVRPPYSLIVICDPTARVEVPDWPHGASLAASGSCILCGCYPEMDGPTELTFATGDEIPADGRPVFEGTLKTPGYKIALETAEGDGIVSMPTKRTETLVRIWTNRSRAPDRIVVGVD